LECAAGAERERCGDESKGSRACHRYSNAVKFHKSLQFYALCFVNIGYLRTQASRSFGAPLPEPHLILDGRDTADATHIRKRLLYVGVRSHESTQLNLWLLKVSTLISSDFSDGSLNSAAFTFVVMALSSMYCPVLSRVVVAAQPAAAKHTSAV